MIATTRLELRPHRPAHLLALIEGNEQYEQVSGLKPAEGLREFYVCGDVSPEFLDQIQNDAECDPWVHGFAVILRGFGLVVGSAGFKGRADAEGVVEIGYGTVPAYQGRGFATEAANALISFASRDATVRKIRAHTLPEPNASARVLEKCGLQFIGEIIDPDDGLVWRWERPAAHVQTA